MIIKPPNKIIYNGKPSIFLAGSIEMGKAIDWQQKCSDILDEAGWIVYNPRRDNWDSSWEQSIENVQFKEQVCWELEAIEISDVVLFYFAPDTKSPISLLELGLCTHNKKCGVICPDGFWRKGNVDIVCERYNLKQLDSFEDAAIWLDL